MDPVRCRQSAHMWVVVNPVTGWHCFLNICLYLCTAYCYLCKQTLLCFGSATSTPSVKNFTLVKQKLELEDRRLMWCVKHYRQMTVLTLISPAVVLIIHSATKLDHIRRDHSNNETKDEQLLTCLVSQQECICRLARTLRMKLEGCRHLITNQWQGYTTGMSRKQQNSTTKIKMVIYHQLFLLATNFLPKLHICMCILWTHNCINV